MLDILLATAVIVAIMLVYYVGVVRMLVNPRSILRRTVRRVRQARQAKTACADLDREYASLLDEHRIP